MKREDLVLPYDGIEASVCRAEEGKVLMDVHMSNSEGERQRQKLGRGEDVESPTKVQL